MVLIHFILQKFIGGIPLNYELMKSQNVSKAILVIKPVSWWRKWWKQWQQLQ